MPARWAPPSWAYYYNPANPLHLLFGIEKDPGNTGANPTFVVDSVNLTTTSNPETSTIAYIGSTDQDAIFALGRYWNVYTHTPLTSPVNIRFFYNPADTVPHTVRPSASKASSALQI
jgi:hypothetical protein